MKYTWEPTDFKAAKPLTKPVLFGSVVSRGHKSEHYLIGYIGGGDKPCLVSLRDGMVCHDGLNITEFAEMMNKERFAPVTLARPMLETIVAA